MNISEVSVPVRLFIEVMVSAIVPMLFYTMCTVIVKSLGGEVQEKVNMEVLRFHRLSFNLGVFLMIPSFASMAMALVPQWQLAFDFEVLSLGLLSSAVLLMLPRNWVWANALDHM